MIDVLLISQDPQLISELQKISAVTQCSLEINHKPNQSDIQAAGTVLIDAQVDLLIKHPDVVVITAAEPGPLIWQKAVATNAKYVAFLPDAREWLLENLLPKPQQNTKVIGVLGATGGLGTSVAASCLAINYAKNNKTVLLAEAEKFSGGLDVLWGIEEVPGSRWANLINPIGRISSKDLLQSLPVANGVAVLSTDSGDAKLPENVQEILNGLSEQVEVMVIDLPNPADPICIQLLEICTEVVVLCGATIRSTNATNQIIQLVDRSKFAGIVIRELPGSSLAALSIAKTIGCNLLTEIKHDQKITEHLEQGLNPALIPSNNFLKAITEIYTKLEARSGNAV